MCHGYFYYDDKRHREPPNSRNLHRLLGMPACVYLKYDQADFEKASKWNVVNPRQLTQYYYRRRLHTNWELHQLARSRKQPERSPFPSAGYAGHGSSIVVTVSNHGYCALTCRPSVPAPPRRTFPAASLLPTLHSINQS